MRSLRNLLVASAALALIWTLTPSDAEATPMITRFSGTANGMLDGTTFEEAPFTMEANSDTTDIEDSANISAADSVATILIQGFALATFTLDTLPFVNRFTEVVGLHVDDVPTDVIQFSCGDPCSTFYLRSNLGPMPGAAIGSGVAIPTDQGVLHLDGFYDVTFEHWIVPEPSTSLLLAFGLAGLAAGRRRRAL